MKLSSEPLIALRFPVGFKGVFGVLSSRAFGFPKDLADITLRMVKISRVALD